MQIEAEEKKCPACGSAALVFAPVYHHMLCVHYVGPEYDFPRNPTGYTCPKCRRDIVSGDRTCEIVGTSARCGGCGTELVVSPPAASNC